MYLVDTNILIWILRGKEQYIKWFEKESIKSKMTISVVNVSEIYQNVMPSEILETEEFISKFALWDVTNSIAKQAGLYWQQYVKKIKNMSLLDCMIAATAREYELDLVTLNNRHFPMNDIKIITP